MGEMYKIVKSYLLQQIHPSTFLDINSKILWLSDGIGYILFHNSFMLLQRVI